MTARVERIYMEIGDRLRVARKRAGISQELLAKRTGFVRTSIVNIEAGRQRVMLHDLKRLAKAAGITPQVLMRGVWS